MSQLLLVLGFAPLIEGAAFLVEGASSIAPRLKISDPVIGLTVVAPCRAHVFRRRKVAVAISGQMWYGGAAQKGRSPRGGGRTYDSQSW